MFPHDAPCHGHPDVMFPASTAGRTNWRPALALCAQCPYHAECRDVWLTLDDDMRRSGVWFGTTPTMRDSDRAARRAAASRKQKRRHRQHTFRHPKDAA